MIAIAFLTLMVGSACIDGFSMLNSTNWPWDPLTRNVETEDHVCLTDSSACGCCLMQQNLHSMEQIFNLSLALFEQNLMETRTMLDNIIGSRSAFSVALTDRRWCIGPRDVNQTIIYEHVFLNLGNDYNPTNGRYTAPRNGVYSFAMTVYSDAGSSTINLQACATMTLNGNPVAIIRDTETFDHEDSATSVLALHLYAGDVVMVVLPAGCYLCDDQHHYNTFTGFQIY